MSDSPIKFYLNRGTASQEVVDELIDTLLELNELTGIEFLVIEGSVNSNA